MVLWPFYISQFIAYRFTPPRRRNVHLHRLLQLGALSLLFQTIRCVDVDSVFGLIGWAAEAALSDQASVFVVFAAVRVFLLSADTLYVLLARKVPRALQWSLYMTACGYQLCNLVTSCALFALVPSGPSSSYDPAQRSRIIWIRGVRVLWFEFVCVFVSAVSCVTLLGLRTKVAVFAKMLEAQDIQRTRGAATNAAAANNNTHRGQGQVAPAAAAAWPAPSPSPSPPSPVTPPAPAPAPGSTPAAAIAPTPALAPAAPATAVTNTRLVRVESAGGGGGGAGGGGTQQQQQQQQQQLRQQQPHQPLRPPATDDRPPTSVAAAASAGAAAPPSPTPPSPAAAAPTEVVVQVWQEPAAVVASNASPASSLLSSRLHALRSAASKLYRLFLVMNMMAWMGLVSSVISLASGALVADVTTTRDPNIAMSSRQPLYAIGQQWAILVTLWYCQYHTHHTTTHKHIHHETRHTLTPPCTAQKGRSSRSESKKSKRD